MIKHQGRRNDLPCSISDPIVLLLPFLSLVLDIPAHIVEASLWFVVVLYARWTCLFFKLTLSLLISSVLNLSFRFLCCRALRKIAFWTARS